MDGASKFVKGDAVAGIIITVINVLGGIIIGITQMGMSAGEAASRFVILTIGDGLVSQVPALLISTAAGILVTRSNSKNNFGKTLTTQLSAFPVALGIAAAIMFAFAIIPSMPTVPFALAGASMGGLSFMLIKEEEKKQEVAMVQEVEEQEEQIRKDLRML